MGEQLLYTINAAARVLSVSRATLYRALARGELRAVRIGCATRISRAELERFVRALEETASRELERVCDVR